MDFPRLRKERFPAVKERKIKTTRVIAIIYPMLGLAKPNFDPFESANTSPRSENEMALRPRPFTCIDSNHNRTAIGPGRHTTDVRHKKSPRTQNKAI
jgi:hypothetical protein